jgi:hypothetical protein
VQSFVDGSQHALRLLQHVVVPKAQHAIASRSEKRGSRRICAGACHVLTPIDLNDDPPLVTGEIDEIGTDGRLAAKMKFLSEQGAQMPPELSLGIGHRTAKLARSRDASVDFPGL